MLTAVEAVAKLDALSNDPHLEPEGGHIEADKIVLEFCPQEIRDAYGRVAESAGGRWYA